MNPLKILIISAFLNISETFAQLLFHPGYIFEKFPVFDSNYIKQHRIQKIIFDIIDKKDWQEAEDKNLTEIYEFYPDGKIKRQYFTSIKKVIQYETIYKKHKNPVIKEQYEYDTTSVSYIYQKNLWIERHTYPNKYTEATYYRYCGKFICKEEKYIESYREMSTGNYVLDKMLLKAQDSIASYHFGNQIKQVFYNNEKLPYKEKFIYFDNAQKIKEISEQLLYAQGKIKKTFEYNADGKLLKATMIIDYGNPETYNIQYEYDNGQNVLSEKHYKNNTLLKEYQYIYSENNNELKSLLIRTFEDKNIRIIKLYYEYYD